MADLKLNTESGSVTLVPENGSGNVDVTIPRAGVGKVLQVVSNSYAIETTLTNGQSAEIFSIAITPFSSNSLFLVNWNTHANLPNNAGLGTLLKRNTNSIYSVSSTQNLPLGITRDRRHQSYQFLDSPNTTEEITYSVSVSAWGTVTANNGNTPTVMTITEIAN